MVGQARSTQRYNKRPADDEEFLTARIIELASQYGRFGYRRVTALLRNEGWIINHKRVERIWRREGLKVPQKQPKRGRLWLNDGSVVRLKPLFPQHVWSYDFMQAHTHNGVPVHIRSDNGAEFTANRVRSWLYNLQVKPLFIEPAQPLGEWLYRILQQENER